AVRDGHEALIEVQDSGVGIPAESIATVFDMFTQVGQNMGRAQGGLGIGLSLVRRLAELHGGSATAASPGAGLGSTFSVRLPLLAEEAKVPAAPAAPAGAVNGPYFRVLVVDDNVDAADTLAAVLDMMGHATQVAHDGAQALAAAPQFLPDVIFLDIGLPGMNGYDVARLLRSEPCGQHAILVAVTGWGQDKDRQLASDAGFDLHLTKPVDFYELDAVLQQMLQAG
ncbi:MAG: response regulator, partial [Janthinobacterium sp.]